MGKKDRRAKKHLVSGACFLILLISLVLAIVIDLSFLLISGLSFYMGGLAAMIEDGQDEFSSYRGGSKTG